MPTPSRVVTGARLSRRAALTAAAAVAGVAVVGCTQERQERRRRGEPRPEEPRVDPDVEVAAEALGSQREMLDLLAATRERHPRLADHLAPAAAAHEAHAALLSDAVPADLPTPSTSPSASPDGRDRRRARVPRNRVRALDRVVRAERELTTALKRDAFRAQSGAFARLLGSMAAAAAQHATELSLASAGDRRPS